MASIRTRTRADGTTAHTVLWREEGHRHATQRSKTFDDPNKALQFKEFLDANNQSYELAADAAEQALAEGVTIREAAHKHITHLTGIEESTRQNYMRILRMHINPTLGSRRATSLTRTDVKAWIQALVTEGCSPSSIDNYHAVLSGVMNSCVEEGLRPDNPAKGIRLPKKDRAKTRRKKIEPEEYAGIVLPEIPAPHRPLIEVLAGTGMRWGEATALLIGDFHPGDRKKDRNGTLTVTKTWKRDGTVGLPKTPESAREIEVGWDLNDLLVRLAGTRDWKDYLLVNPDGTPYQYGEFEYRVWRPAAIRMAAPTRTGGHLHDRPTIHWLRHAHGSWLVGDGVDIGTVSNRLGHSNIATTGDIYIHITEKSRRKVLAVLDALDHGPTEGAAEA